MQPSTVITHPQKPDTSVVVELPRQARRIRMDQARERESVRYVTVHGSDDKPVISPKTGELQTEFMNLPVSVEQQNADLKEYVVEVRNVPTADGAVLSFTRDQKAERERAIIDSEVLWDDHLNVTVTYREHARLVGKSAIAMYESLDKALAEAETEERREELRKLIAASNENTQQIPFARYILLLCSKRETFDPDAEGKASRSS